MKKLCCSLRRNAKDERVLFHYNGHGVPKPTAQGEIWVFNRVRILLSDWFSPKLKLAVNIIITSNNNLFLTLKRYIV